MRWRHVWVVCLSTVWVVGLMAQVRDAPAPAARPSTGSASISGIVVSDDAEARPLRRATVQLTDPASAGRLAITGDDGTFTIRNLAAGRYQVTGSKAAWVTGAYGAPRTATAGQMPAGTAIALGEGQHVEGIRIALARGAVVTGTIRDHDGQPANGARVRLMYYGRSPATGERTLTNTPHTAIADDRGAYRIFGVREGTYAVASTPGVGVFTDVRETTDADVRQARAQIQQSGAAQAPAPAASGATARPRTVGFVPVYYPGTTIAADASLLAVARGEERAGVDFQMQMVTTARIEGVVSLPDGRAAAGALVRLSTDGPSMIGEFGMGGVGVATSAAAGPDGRYRFAGVAPGAYAVWARMGAAPGAAPPGSEPASWAIGRASVRGEDVTLDLGLRPGLTVSGRVRFETTRPETPPDPARVRVMLGSLAGFGTVTATVAAGADATTTFTVAGLVPGEYRLMATMPGGTPIRPAWVARSAVIGGRDVLDGPFEIREMDDLRDMVITFTDRITELAGLIVDGEGQPAPEYFLIAFSRDRTHWIGGSRRVQQLRPAHDGRFSFLNLPAGEYLLAAVTSLEQNQWYDPDFLGELVPASVRIVIKDGERTVQDLKVR